MKLNKAYRCHSPITCAMNRRSKQIVIKENAAGDKKLAAASGVEQ
jgi:hypothetical protein